MRLAVLSSPDSFYVRDLQRAAAGRHDVLCLPFSQLGAAIGLGNSNKAGEDVLCGAASLRDFNAVLVRSMPPGSLEQVVFRMDALGQLPGLGVPVINPPKALEAAIDKYLTSARLAAAGLATPRTVVCQTADDALAAFSDLGRDVVVKPLFGSEGRGLTRISDVDLAERAFTMLERLGAVLYLQEFVEHEGCDLRLLVLGERVFGMRRCNAGDWRTNVSRGATTEPLEVTPELASIALRAAACVGAPLAGVDLLPARDGRLLAIEVNAVPGWKALSRTLHVDIAALVLDYVESLL